VYTHCT